MAIQHWMTFGTFAEQRYFIYPDANTYYGIIINGNMATHAPAGLAAFLIEKTRPKIPYIIDPLTHAFQHDPSVIMSKKKDGSLEVKGPIKDLSGIYGEPLTSLLGSKPLLPRDLNDTELFKEFVYNVLRFQKEHLSKLMAESETNKKYLEHPETELEPYALVSPYFYMTESSYKDWLPLMTKAINIAKEADEFKSCKIFSSIVVSQGVILNTKVINEIVGEMEKTSVDGFLFWVDGLQEHNAGSMELKGMINFTNSLRNNSTREIINLHGGYFSILAGGGQFGQSSFTGVAHGPEFGETRPVIPVGGGIPIAKYYVKTLHNRIKYIDAVSYFNTKGLLENSNIFHKYICNCDECQKVLNGNTANFRLYGITDSKPVKRGSGFVTIDYPTKETKEHCLKHYLQNKKEEYEFASNSSKEDLVDDLLFGFAQYKEITGVEYLSYLDIWRKVLLNEI